MISILSFALLEVLKSFLIRIWQLSMACQLSVSTRQFVETSRSFRTIFFFNLPSKNIKLWHRNPRYQRPVEVAAGLFHGPLLSMVLYKQSIYLTVQQLPLWASMWLELLFSCGMNLRPMQHWKNGSPLLKRHWFHTIQRYVMWFRKFGPCYYRQMKFPSAELDSIPMIKSAQWLVLCLQTDATPPSHFHSTRFSFWHSAHFVYFLNMQATLSQLHRETRGIVRPVISLTNPSHGPHG